MLCRCNYQGECAEQRFVYPAFAASLAYYAMFYVAEAFLEGEGLSFWKHWAVMTAFGREFAKTGRVSVEFHRYLIEAQQMRATGDYGPFEEVAVPHAQEQIARAKEFLAAAGRLLGPHRQGVSQGSLIPVAANLGT